MGMQSPIASQKERRRKRRWPDPIGSGFFYTVGYFRKHCCYSTVHEPNKARVGQITFVRPSTFVRFTQRWRDVASV
jgi:hypothetical protein